MENVTFNEIKSLINSIDKEINTNSNLEYNKENVSKEFEEKINFHNDKKSVLGIDIYQYSKFPFKEQSLIPFLIKFIIEKSKREILNNDKFLFQNLIENDILNLDYINTGDGGFFIFETPLHSIVFSIYVEFYFRSFNSGKFLPKLRTYLGPLTLRYANTFDTIFKFDNNFYGPGIINNARILSKDKLNRYLIDENTYNWFLFKMNGIESLRAIKLEELINTEPFSNYTSKDLTGSEYSAISKHYAVGAQNFGIIESHIQKIGTIAAKKDLFSIYNLHLQFTARLHNNILDNNGSLEGTDIIFSLGNLNTTGIIVE
ncbi:hypothetical protein EHR01_08145 [Leptospira mtsangambouensis]|uniref:Uncharacterized protein n=1 Tax=Leptospira mtsangambouensis TaxID=2484912 RepID=A0ABY2P1F8_9LEPT|nr:hypothetical protein [Leptospira mtsangambouensis]TGM78080.1 hypothetical protein EHR01_08145 [Leptospira mtsangambouensis]